MFQLKPKTLYHWYRNCISDYHQDKAEGRFAAHNVYDYDEQTGEVKKQQVVHIFKPGNVAPAMSIDEKMIGKKYSTIVSNQVTGKIALLVETMKPALIRQALALLPEEKLHQIKHISSDMSPVYKKLCKEMMPDAQITIDKFHVVKHILDALNTVRLRIKHQLKQSTQPNAINPNQWTDVELLEKTKYLLYKRSPMLDPEETQLLNHLFTQHPDLYKAYNLTEQIRSWYDSKNIGQPLQRMHHQLNEWISQVRVSKLKPFSFVIKMFEKHWEDILRYFQQGHTNAKAENLNARIQRFIIANYGTRDKDFFLYRTQLYFA